jgi:hypothetical protein
MCRAFVLQALVLVAACGGGADGSAPPTTPPTSQTPPTETPPTTTPPAPTPKPPLAFVSGAGASDTIDAATKIRLTVRVLDDSGAPRRNEIVLLRVRAAPLGSPTGSVITGTLDDLAVTTDTLGLGSTNLQFGVVAGTSYVLAFDSHGHTDSAAFTVRPGAPARIRLAPRDTALFVGGRYGLGGALGDRHGNPVTATLRYAADSATGVASVTSAGTVTGNAVGRSRFLVGVSGGPILDTARVTVVPPGKLVVVADEGLSILNMDGSSFRTLVPGGAYQFLFPSWSPDGTAVVYNSADITRGVLYRVDLQGRITTLSGNAAMSSETWPRYSADGQYIYFSGGYYPDSIDTYRMRSDGTGPRVRVTPFRPYSDRYWKASPSPDGTLLAYSEAGFALHVVSLVDGIDRTLPVPTWAEAPRFDPSGDWIAYANEYSHSIELIRTDGTGHRVLTPSWESADDWGHDWSPDGAWIIYSRSSGLSIVRVADGLILPLPFGHYLYAASWHQ